MSAARYRQTPVVDETPQRPAPPAPLTSREVVGHVLAGVVLGLVIFAPPLFVLWGYFR